MTTQPYNCVCATYTNWIYFRCPYDLNEVDDYFVRFSTLYVVVKGEVSTYQPYNSPNWKKADCVELLTEKDIGYDSTK